MKNGSPSAPLIIAITVLLLFVLSCKVDTIDFSKSTGLVSLEIKPENPSMAPGTALQLEAFGRFSNNSVRKLEQEITWSSSNTALGTVSRAGIVNSPASSSGTITITAKAENVSGSTIISFSLPASIRLEPSDVSIAPGTSQQFKAFGTLHDASVQDLTAFSTWNSSEPTIAAISGPGLVSASSEVVAGTATISASFGTLTGSGLLTSAAVQFLSVTPANPTISAGTTQQFTAKGTLVNSATQNVTSFATWSSSSPDVAIINTSGLAIPVAPGNAVITAAFGNQADSAVLTVSQKSAAISRNLVSLVLVQSNQTIAFGSTVQFTAFGLFSDGSMQDMTFEATWISSNTITASISNASSTKGLLTALAAGTTGISASFSGILSNLVTLTVAPGTDNNAVSIIVTPSNPTVRLGSGIQFDAALVSGGMTLETLTSTATWKSSNSDVASVAQGFATGLRPGTTTITATSGSVSGSTILTVTSL